jgi:predicted hotdog family 3-hydroxylacyl-ACP dehydratase
VNKTEICQLLPHSGTMCLIDEIVSWDAKTLVARTESHLRADNPLRYDASVSSIIGIEYAAQTMALHAGLLYRQESNSASMPEKKGGYLATLRNIQLHADKLYSPEEVIQSALEVSVLVLMSDSQGYTYEFNITCNTIKLLSGKLTIFLTANA